MKNNLKTVFWMMSIALISCDAPSDRTMDIRGSIEGAEGQYIFFQAYDGTGTKDSALIAQDGSFELATENRPLDYYRLFLDETQQPVVLILDSTQTAIEVKASADDMLGSYDVTGSKDSEVMRTYFRTAEQYRAKLDSVNQLMMSIPPDADQMIKLGMNQARQQLVAEYEQAMKTLAIDNVDSPAALSIISSVDPKKAMPEYEKVAQSMQTRIPDSKFLATLTKNIDAAKKAIAQEEKQAQALAHMRPGRPAPEIALNDPNGQEVSLSSLKGKYVLIDFWASWCGPCRRENPNVVKLYEKYGGKDFEILGVSLDGSKDRWLQAIEKDGLEWLHVSDLAKWNSVAARDYGVSSIPFTVLVDPNGSIVATKLRGKALEAKLEEIFGA